jgi:hypothetical protein
MHRSAMSMGTHAAWAGFHMTVFEPSYQKRGCQSGLSLAGSGPPAKAPVIAQDFHRERID